MALPVSPCPCFAVARLVDKPTSLGMAGTGGPWGYIGEQGRWGGRRGACTQARGACMEAKGGWGPSGWVAHNLGAEAQLEGGQEGRRGAGCRGSSRGSAGITRLPGGSSVAAQSLKDRRLEAALGHRQPVQQCGSLERP